MPLLTVLDARSSALTAAVVAVGALLLGGCGEDEPAADQPAADQPAADQPTASGGGPCDYLSEGSAARDVDLPPSTPDPAESMTIATNLGEIGVTLDAEGTPCTAGSFTSLAEQGYFDDTRCHRLTTGGIFVLQCGDPTGTGSGGPGYRFADELTGEETYPAGTLAMANSGADTNGSQFFIVYADSRLPPSYTVFGEVDAEGLALVEKVAEAGADDSNGPGDGAPLEEVVIESVG